MARFEFRLPDVGEGIAEAEIVAWHVKVGDVIEEDQRIADLMTDKATVEMESPVAGKVLELAGAVGDQVAIGSVLVVLETDQETGARTPRKKSAASVKPPAGKPADKTEASDRQTRPKVMPRRTAKQAAAMQVAASPAVRQRARDLGIDLASVKSASGDRIRHSDLDSYLLYHGGAVAGPAVPLRPDEQVKVVGLRRRIAENMQEANRRIPHFSYVEEVDMTAIEATRAMMNGDRGDRQRLTPLPFLIMALCRAVASFPQINAHFDDETGVVTRFGAVHVGVATQTDAGLMVPVLRNAQNMDIWTLAAEIVRLSEAARSASADRDELSGSTITISSLGALGSIAATPVINRPEVGILAINKIADRPVAIDGRVEIRKMMNLSSSFDHRVVDGWEGASFIQEIKRLLERPLLLLSLR